MKLKEFTRLLSPTYWILLAIAAAIIVIWLAVIFTAPGRSARAALEAKVGRVTAEGKAAASRDAVDVVVKGGQRDTMIDNQVREASNELRQAPEDERNRLALARLCMSDAARSQPACVELRNARPN